MKTRAADRTRTRRHRVGSRRNKHLRNVGPQPSDYPTRYRRFYHCDGSFSHAQAPQ